MPYYLWDAKKDKFVKSKKPPKKKIEVFYRLAKNKDKEKIIDFEMECQKLEPEIFISLSSYKTIKRKWQKINLAKRDNFATIIALTKKERKVVGILSMGWYFDNYDEEIQKVGVISLLFVLKPFRMAGIGKGLINFSQKIFRKWGVKRIELKVGIKNLAGLEFYRKLKFKIRKIGLATLDF